MSGGNSHVGGYFDHDRETFRLRRRGDGAGALIGIVTDGDLSRHMDDGLMRKVVGEVMTSKPKTIRAGALAAEALGFMNANKITCLFVTQDGGAGNMPVGILHVHDILRAGIA